MFPTELTQARVAGELCRRQQTRPAPRTFNKNFLDLADELVHLQKRVPHELGNTVQTMCEAEAVEDVGVQLLKALPRLDTVGGTIREEEEHLLIVQVTPNTSNRAEFTHCWAVTLLVVPRLTKSIMYHLLGVSSLLLRDPANTTHIGLLLLSVVSSMVM